jgi:hypothetical protein
MKHSPTAAIRSIPRLSTWPMTNFFAFQLIAQMGTAKTAIGWLIVLLCIALGLIVVCRPSSRNAVGPKKHGGGKKSK